ncbi:Hpt domain-containing protein, partial [Rhizobiales bacterium L72]
MLDAVHLERQTLADPALKREVLGLFVAALEDLVRDAGAPGASPSERDRHLHAILGLARNVGAFRLAAAAADAMGARRGASAGLP